MNTHGQWMHMVSEKRKESIYFILSKLVSIGLVAMNEPSNANGLITSYRLGYFQTSTMNLFAEIFNDFRPFTINTAYLHMN